MGPRGKGVLAIAALACAGAAMLAASACSSSKDATPVASAPDAADGEWTIGVSNSLSGSLQAIGAPLHKAWMVAERYVNANGGVRGKKIRFVEIDDGSDDDTQSDQGALVRKVADQLIGLNVAAVMGPNGSSQVATAQGLYFQNHVLEISATATSTRLSSIQPDAGRFLFRTVPPDDLQGRALAKLANLGPAGIAADAGAGGDGGPGGCARMAMFYYDNDYGQPMADVVKHDFTGTIVTEVKTSSTRKADYTTEVNAIVGANPTCLAMIVYDDVGDAFLRALTESVGSAPPFWIMGTDGVYDDAFITNGRIDPGAPSSSTVVEGVYGTNPDTDPPDSPDYQFFKKLYALAYPIPAGGDVEAYASNEFDAAMLIALAIEEAGGVSDRDALRDAFVAVSDGHGYSHGPQDFIGAVDDILGGRAIDYEGASGPCMIDPGTGDVQAGYIVWQVQGGAFTTLRHLKVGDL